MRSESNVQDALEATIRKFGKLDGVINCAGVFQNGDELFNMETQKPGDYKVLTDIVTVKYFTLLKRFLLKNTLFPD